MYEAQLYRPGHEKLTVQIHSSPEGLQMESEAGPVVWPYASLELGWGGAELKMASISQGGQSLYVANAELLRALEPHLGPTQQVQLRRILRRRRWGLWKGLLGLTAAGLLLGCAGYWLMLRGRDLAISRIPVSWEESIGEQVYTQQLAETPACPGKALAADIRRLELRLERSIPDSRYDLRFQVVKADPVNAFALPGGRIALNAALVARAPSAEALLGVMAHEAQHVLERHSLKGLVNKFGVSLAIPLILGDAGTLMGTLAGAGAGLLNLGFDRSQESEADLKGLELMHRAGIDPKGMEAFFSWMSAEESMLGRLPEFLSTHPLSSERLSTIHAAIAKLPPVAYKPIDVDWPALKAKAVDCLAGK